VRTDWNPVVGEELQKPYWSDLQAFVRSERERATVYPPPEDVFAALHLTPFRDVKVVILGQDPYHGPGQAHGLCFSVPPGIAAPPSLQNIFAEIERDLGAASMRPGRPDHGCLLPWARQGVLLLNAVLTVEDGRPGSHANRGWEAFTDAIVQRLAARRDGLVFMLWGAYAQRKGGFIDRRHCVLRAPHPSPLSAHRGFIGCGHFGAANRWLAGRDARTIEWRLPPRVEVEPLYAAVG
jgi:uracil-DNA glycosylase